MHSGTPVTGPRDDAMVRFANKDGVDIRRKYKGLHVSNPSSR